MCDVECYPNFFMVGFKRVSDGKRIAFWFDEHNYDFWDERRVRSILARYTIITFNGRSYDLPMLAAALEHDDPDPFDLKEISNKLIKTKYWDVARNLKIDVPGAWDHIDLFDVNPSLRASLKELNGRLHGRHMEDLPYPHDMILNTSQKRHVREYNDNDLDATGLLLSKLDAAIDLRYRLGERYQKDFRSKSDAQMGEAILIYRYEKETRSKVRRSENIRERHFDFTVPPHIEFYDPQLLRLSHDLNETRFSTSGTTGKINKPRHIENRTIILGEMAYTFGIGGLHSTESSRSIVCAKGYRLRDFDVGSMYPKLIVNSNRFPRAFGPEWSHVYNDMRVERIGLKAESKKVYAEAGKHTKKSRDLEADAEGLKIALNGGGYGKLGSPYSPQFDPAMLLNVTLPGQLAILMLIERALEIEGMRVVSGNTDGVVFYYPEELTQSVDELCREWEKDCQMELEDTDYIGLFSQSVNSYIAIKKDGTAKRKGNFANPYASGDVREQMKLTPSMNICGDAVVEFILSGTPLRHTIENCTDMGSFVLVMKATGGSTWRGEPIGKVVRFYWSVDGDPLYKAVAHHSTGRHPKVPMSDGCRPMMTFDGTVPADLDYDRYVATAEQMVRDIGYDGVGKLVRSSGITETLSPMQTMLLL